MNEPPDPVFSPGLSVAVTILGQKSGPQIATVVEMIGPAVRLRMSHPLPTGTAVKMEGADTLLLADVNFSDPGPECSVVGFTVRHMLTALAELTRLGIALRGEQEPPPVIEPATADEPEAMAVKRKIVLPATFSRIMEE